MDKYEIKLISFFLKKMYNMINWGNYENKTLHWL